MIIVIPTTQINLNSSNVGVKMRAICDGLAFGGHVVVLIDKWGRHWRWRSWKVPLANSPLEWQEKNKPDEHD